MKSPVMQRRLVPAAAAADFFNPSRWNPSTVPHPRVRQRVRFSISPLLFPGNATGPDQTSDRPRPRAGEDGARVRARGPGAGPEPRDERPRRLPEPHGGGPQAQSSGYPRSSAGGEGGADATFSSEAFSWLKEDGNLNLL